MSLADDIARAMLEGGEDGIMLAARAVLEAAERNVPVGDPEVDPDPSVSLRDSGRIEVVPNQFGPLVRVSFDTPYAAKVHEDQRLKHPRGGGAKFLERAATEIIPALDRIVASQVDANTATGMLSDPRRSHHRRRRA